ncbi:MAG: isoprenoid biosynthesis glyoxalase ElbB [Brachymonas sp.]|nr:isoprenoid biosynthesis glyoxalase ElbB [Brachymonas sp.]
MNISAPCVAVILSGCGFQDGSEIHEAVCTLLALDQQGAKVQCFAPDVEQARVVNHLSNDEVNESRNVLIESARIARGAVQPLSAFDASEFDALVIPGGLGAALNLSNFAALREHCTIQQDVANAVTSMHQAGKPIGAMCIAPVILAKLIPGARLTIGQNATFAQACQNMWAEHRNASEGEVVVDTAKRLVSTPCYMLEASISQIYISAQSLTQELLKMVRQQ